MLEVSGTGDVEACLDRDGLISFSRHAEVVEFGRHAILRGWWATPVGVRVPSSAPEDRRRPRRKLRAFCVWETELGFRAP